MPPMSTMPVLRELVRLPGIWRNVEPGQDPLQVAGYDGRDHLLDVFLQRHRRAISRPSWNSGRCPSISSIIDFQHEPDLWLRGRTWTVCERWPDRYVVESTRWGAGFAGRLRLHWRNRLHGTDLTFATGRLPYGDLPVGTRVRAGREFPGYDWLDVGFEELESLHGSNRSDWSRALRQTKGIYMVTDTLRSRHHVDTARGDDDLWSQWSAWVGTGRRDLIGPRRLLEGLGREYCRAHLRFALLESNAEGTADEAIVARARRWMQALPSQSELLI